MVPISIASLALLNIEQKGKEILLSFICSRGESQSSEITIDDAEKKLTNSHHS